MALKSLKEIEKRLEEIENEIGEINVALTEQNFLIHTTSETDLAKLQKERSVLVTRRGFILDRRNNWKAVISKDVIVPIAVATVTTYVANLLF